ncbi:MAG: hypothetical protein HDT11_03335 [Helicobacter sp.]|nr:hypothetical protein [Helicobacter sp.]MBD5167915.1 hypothetical protein [Helicobacter sp.]MDE5816661.1 hypothetical protein [Helicobacter sp.]MDE6044427.1 hypothetical protein [Helicobacter sp.]MDE7195393.1 hypothetical protein [Helicobacter sp.]
MKQRWKHAKWCLCVAAVLVVGCSVTNSGNPEFFNSLWEAYKEGNAGDDPQAFIEYKEAKKEQRRFVQRQTRHDKDYSKRLLLGVIDATTFVASTTLTPVHAENLLLTPIYMVEDYASQLPVGEDAKAPR